MTGIPRSVEIITLADVPSRGTGLGSSSSVTIGLPPLEQRPVVAHEPLDHVGLVSNRRERYEPHLQSAA